MKTSSKTLLIVGLGATQALSRALPRDPNHLVRTRNSSSPNAAVVTYNTSAGFEESNLFPDSSWVRSETEPLLMPPADDEFRWFNFADAIEIIEMPDRGGLGDPSAARLVFDLGHPRRQRARRAWAGR